MNIDFSQAQDVSQSGLYGFESKTPDGISYMVFKTHFPFVIDPNELAEMLDWIASSGDGSPFVLVSDWHEQDHLGKSIWKVHPPKGCPASIVANAQTLAFDAAPWRFYAFG